MLFQMTSCFAHLGSYKKDASAPIVGVGEGVVAMFPVSGSFWPMFLAYNFLYDRMKLLTVSFYIFASRAAIIILDRS